MAATFTYKEGGLGSDGKAWEKGTWVFDGGTTTGNLVSGSSTGFLSSTPKISVIEGCDLASDGDNTVRWASDVARNTVKITSAANDTGTYYITGPSAG